MALKGLSQFEKFDLEAFLQGKRIVFVKAAPWTKEKSILGSSVIVQIFEDQTDYGKAEVSNFGEQLAVKVRNITPEAFQRLTPLQTEVVIQNVEKASIFGEFRNQLSITGMIAVKESATK